MVKCSHCGAPAEWGCTRLVERYVQTTVGAMSAGDQICRMDEVRPKPGSHAVVACIGSDGKRGLRITIVIYRDGRPDRNRTFDADPRARYKRLEMVPCGDPICDNCAQDPGEPHRYCPDHWTIRTLESAAA